MVVTVIIVVVMVVEVMVLLLLQVVSCRSRGDGRPRKEIAGCDGEPWMQSP